MTYFEWISSEIGNREEKIIILMQLLSCTRGHLFSQGTEKMRDSLRREADEILERRNSGMPLQYAIGRWCFYGYDFHVGKGVLIPRPETELLVDLILHRVHTSRAKVWDVCTGSGAIGLTLAKEHEDWQLLLSDISEDALSYAEKNKNALSVQNVEIRCGDLLSVSTDEDYDVIVSNPPYIRRDVISTLSSEVRDYEPIAALDGGEDGLSFYRRLLSEAKHRLKPGGKIFLEIGYDQGKGVSELARAEEYRNVEVIRDLSGSDRIVVAERR